MKFLLDSEILKWNERLPISDISGGYMVSPQYGSKNSYPMISFKYHSKRDMSFSPTTEPFLEFQFSFSVAKNRVDLFWDIFENWYENEIGNEVLFDSGGDNIKVSSIIVSDSIIQSKSEINHMISSKEYVKYTYNFKGKLGSIMAYVMFLEDTIDIFSTIYGYTEDGVEVNLTKYQIGDMVSKTSDKSKDYLIIDISPKKVGKKFYIDYHISEVLTIGDIIRYGSTQKVSDNEICYSRNSRIDDILDK
jgi:hypothetical protein